MNEGSNVKTINGRRVLVITPGDEYKPKVEGIKDFEVSIFADKYQKAATLILEVLRANLKESNQQDYPQHDCGQRVSGISPDYFNNIIVFDGERGSGKTSAVKSILLAFDALRCLKDNELNTEYYGEWRELKNEYSFNTSLDVIDPSMFEQNSNIIEVIISRMFKRTMEYLKDPCARTSNSNGGDIKSKLIELFSKVKENLAIMKNGDSVNRELGDSSIEILQKLACTSDLKLNLIELIEVYNKFIIGEKTTNVLVLCIDDLDMNIKSGFEMLDQIYKYLIIPNVIIIFGTKMQQLVRIVTDEFSAKAGIKQEEEYARQMAENYLNKLLSPNHRLKLDYLSEDIGQYTVVIKEKKDATVDIFGDKVEGKVASQIPYEYLQESIAKLIYKYTGVEIVISNNGIHPITPRTLRRLCQLVTLLFQMKKNMSANNESIEVMINNLEFFYHYLKNFWVPDNLSIAFKSIFDKWIEYEPDSKKWLIQSLVKIVGDSNISAGSKQFVESVRPEFYERISSRLVNPYNISLGDIHFFLESCRRFTHDEDIFKAVYAFEQVYMIKLARAYYNLKISLLLNRDTTNCELIETDYKRIRVLLGGALISPLEFKLLPSEGSVTNRRDFINIDLNELYETVSKITVQKVPEVDADVINSLKILNIIELLYYSIFMFLQSDKETTIQDLVSDEVFYEFSNYTLGNASRKRARLYLPRILISQFYGDEYRKQHFVLTKIDEYRGKIDKNRLVTLPDMVRYSISEQFVNSIKSSKQLPSLLQWSSWVTKQYDRPKATTSTVEHLYYYLRFMCGTDDDNEKQRESLFDIVKGGCSKVGDKFFIDENRKTIDSHSNLYNRLNEYISNVEDITTLSLVQGFVIAWEYLYERNKSEMDLAAFNILNKDQLIKHIDNAMQEMNRFVMKTNKDISAETRKTLSKFMPNVKGLFKDAKTVTDLKNEIGKIDGSKLSIEKGKASLIKEILKLSVDFEHSAIKAESAPTRPKLTDEYKDRIRARIKSTLEELIKQ